MIAPLITLTSAGSSPLTRGKRRSDRRAWRPHGLIPAHAGKTACRRMLRAPQRAHPRSRGENQETARDVVRPVGSSPLTRGKRFAFSKAPPIVRLIPAHAGKTGDRDAAFGCCQAHPRSRGENVELRVELPHEGGSSPLTRGKLVNAAKAAGTVGLIPAHAGKTGGIVFAWDFAAAHPRSRGENSRGSLPAQGMTGSSPLTRGKH